MATLLPINTTSICTSEQWLEADDRWLAETAHANGLAIDLKNAGGLIQVSEEYKTAVVAAFDYNVIESCVIQSCSRLEFC